MYSISVCIAVSNETLWQEIHSALRELPVRVAFEQAGIGDLAAFLEKVEHLRPDAVMLDLFDLPCEFAQLMEALSSCSPAPFIIVVHPEGRPDLILETMRAGAREFLVPPLAGTLQTALLRLSAERERAAPTAKRGGRLVGFLSAKGGCGATTVACHVARLLEQETHQPTLLGDFDLCSGMIRFLMQASSRYSVLDAFANVQRLDHSYWHALVSNGKGHLDVIAGPETPPLKEVPGLQQIRHVVRFMRTEYEWTVLDLGRGLSPCSYAAIEELDDLFILTTPDIPALHQVKALTDQLFSHGLSQSTLHLVLNRMNRRLEVTAAELEKLLGLPFYSILSDDTQALHEACSESRLLGADSTLARELKDLVCKLADIPVKTVKKRFSLFG
ncbi:MAG: hypothetical protein IPP47_28320 [Bryobacterales bacterium]|nr:hypothetical protein [Bryobacterales bacterium]